MPAYLDLAPLFLMGFLGSAHCVGMCGGFSLMAARTGWWPGYALGKTSTYVLLGAAAGGIAHLAMTLAPVQRVLGTAAGMALLVIGAATAGLIPDSARFGVTDRFAPLLASALRRFSGGGAVALGALNGLLPCGLVYAGLALAAESASAATGAVLMGAFGAGTLPVLALLPVVTSRLGGTAWRRIVTSGGWLVMVLGVITLWRTWVPMTPH